MKSNLAHDLEAEEFLKQSKYVSDYRDEAPLVKPELQELTVPKGLSRFEVTLISIISIILFGLLLLNISSGLQLSTNSRKVQDLTSQIETTEMEIENIKQHVHELSRYDRIHEIAEKYGLELQEENILNLSPIE